MSKEILTVTENMQAATEITEKLGADAPKPASGKYCEERSKVLRLAVDAWRRQKLGL